MDMNAKLKRIAAMLVAVILVLQVAPAGTANEPVERHTIYSEWWRPNPNPKTPTAEYTFSDIGDTVLLPYLLGLSGIYGNITDVVTDSAAVELDDNLYLKAVSYFDQGHLRRHRGDGGRRKLHRNRCGSRRNKTCRQRF